MYLSIIFKKIISTLWLWRADLQAVSMAQQRWSVAVCLVGCVCFLPCDAEPSSLCLHMLSFRLTKTVFDSIVLYELLFPEACNAVFDSIVLCNLLFPELYVGMQKLCGRENSVPQCLNQAGHVALATQWTEQDGIKDEVSKGHPVGRMIGKVCQ